MFEGAASGVCSVARGSATRVEPDVAAARPPSLPALERLGPVLLISRPALARLPGWVLRHGIDSSGIREFLDAGGERVHRLPDSDFLGWERAACACRAHPAASGPPPPREAQAWVVQARNGAWEPVLRLSALGWEVVRCLLQAEHAQLRSGAPPAPGIERRR